MARVTLAQLALARSGDKGNNSNIGVIARTPGIYDFLARELTAEVVKGAFRDICKGEVRRYELPNLCALNFVLHNTLGGGASEALITDPQGKVHASALLQLVIDVPHSLVP